MLNMINMIAGAGNTDPPRVNMINMITGAGNTGDHITRLPAPSRFWNFFGFLLILAHLAESFL